MEKINLEIYLQEADPVGAPNWDGKTVIYLTYEYPVVGLDEGTVLIGKLDEDVGKICDVIARKIEEILRPEVANIHFWNGEKRKIAAGRRAFKTEFVDKLEQSKYEAIINGLRSRHPDIVFETKK